MKASTPPGLTASELLALWEAQRLNFYDNFDRGEPDTELWIEGLDGTGAYDPNRVIADPASFNLVTGNLTDNDSYIHGLGALKNKFFSPLEDGYTTVTWTARLRHSTAALLSSMWGLINAPITDYAEPAVECAHFLADPAISATYRVRTYDAAEEETDTLVALDAVAHDFKIIWTAAGVLFYIDDVLVATHATQVPDFPATSEFLVRTEANAEVYMILQSLEVEYS